MRGDDRPTAFLRGEDRVRVKSASGGVARYTCIGVAVVLLTFLAGCGGGNKSSGSQAAAGTPATAGEEQGASAGPDQAITVAIESEPLGLDPQKWDDATALSVTWGLYDTLYDFDDGEVVPNLAADEAKQVGPRSWEVNLKPDIKFTGGETLDADDVVYSYNRIVDPKLESAFNEIANIKGATKVDDDTVRINTVEPDPVLPRRLTAIKIVPDGMTEFDKPNGTGPYTLSSFDKTSAVLEYNPDYHGEKPQVTKVTVRVIPDAASRIAALKTGEVDLIAGLSPDDFGQVPKVVASSTDAYTTLVRLNATRAPMDDVRVRQAVNYAVNTKEITDKLFQGKYATPLPCQLAPTDVESSSKVLKPYPYDPAKAKQLVEEAGAAGKPVTLNWVTGGAFPLDRDVGQLVAQQVETNTGLKVSLKLLDYANWIESLRSLGDDGAEMNFVVVSNPMHSIARVTGLMYPSDGGLGDYKDPKMDTLYAKAASTFEPDRQQAWEDVLKYGCDQAAVLFLYSYKAMFGVTKRMNVDWESENRPKYTKITVSK
jgi:peptide/nickel transport system substrate-binding protein